MYWEWKNGLTLKVILVMIKNILRVKKIVKYYYVMLPRENCAV